MNQINKPKDYLLKEFESVSKKVDTLKHELAKVERIRDQLLILINGTVGLQQAKTVQSIYVKKNTRIPELPRYVQDELLINMAKNLHETASDLTFDQQRKLVHAHLKLTLEEVTYLLTPHELETIEITE